MAENKTKETSASVTDFINAVPDEKKRADAFRIAEFYRQQTGFEPKMWGPTIIGFGSIHYKYASGHEGDMPLAGFSPRKDSIVLYCGDYPGRGKMLEQLGKHKIGKVCIYVKRFDDIDHGILAKMVADDIRYTKAKYP